MAPKRELSPFPTLVAVPCTAKRSESCTAAWENHHAGISFRKGNQISDAKHEIYLKGHGNEADFLGFLHKSVRHRFLTLHFADSSTRRVGESFFDYEYLRKFEAKIGTARKVV